MNFIRKLITISTPGIFRRFSVSPKKNAEYSCKVLVVGGGTGGCVMAAKFARRLPTDNVIVLEPSTEHYYQPLWTLVGAGVCKVEDTRRSEASVLPARVKWVRDKAKCLYPECNKLTTTKGNTIHYEYMIIAAGMVNDYSKVPGLYEALEDKESNVSTIFAPEYCEKTFQSLRNIKQGNAIFTYPNTLLKCPGAPQKIAYLADSYLTKRNVRNKINIIYNTCLAVIFGVPKYADELMKVVERKNIQVNYKTVLKEVNHERNEAVFYNKDYPDQDIIMDYSMLHVTPPMYTPDFLRYSSCLVDESGYLEVDKFTLQNKQFPNIYGIGDCTNTPNSKTAAAIAVQSLVLEQNLLSTMKKNEPKLEYNGYGACPLVTSYSTCILAEFVYGGVVRETMPFNQAKESRIAYYMKRDLFPFIYWHFMLKGYYDGPEKFRKLFNPFQN